MLPARQITPPDWMTDYKTVKLMRVLGGYEIPMQALFVGGCVRNTLIGKPVSDIDIATVHHPMHVIEKLKAEGIRFAPTGLDHGTITVIIDDATFEVTTLRKDIDTDGRHAVIAFTENWKEDAYRRDFTINTLLAAADGVIFDPTGQGLADLDLKRVAFVGDPAQRIAEDYLRILRFFRFYAQYGDGVPDADAIAACTKYAGMVSRLSKERVTQEFMKILGTPNVQNILDIMVSCGVLHDMLKAYNSGVMQRLCDLHLRYDAECILGRMVVISGLELSDFSEWLVLSNEQKKNIAAMTRTLKALKSPSKKTVKGAIYREGNAVTLQAYFLRLAERDELPDLELIDLIRYWQAPVFPVKGEDLISAGIMPGPLLGMKIRELEDKWIAKDFPVDFRYKK